MIFAAFLYGIAVGRYQVFPFDQLQQVRQLFAEEKPQRVENPRVSIFEEFSTDVDVVMIGDSLTRNGLWSEFFPDVKIANRGGGGGTTASILGRMDSIYSTKAETAFIMVGVNDFGRKATVDQVYSRYREIIGLLRERGIAVIVQSTLECSRTQCGEAVDKIRALNDLLRAYAGAEEIAFVDLNELLSGANGLKVDYTYDGLHLNGAGYRIWVNRLTDLMAERAN